MSPKAFVAIAMLGAVELAVALAFMRSPWIGAIWIPSLGFSALEGIVLGATTRKVARAAVALVCLAFVTAVPVEIVQESIRQDDANIYPIAFVLYVAQRAASLGAGFACARRATAGRDGRA